MDKPNDGYFYRLTHLSAGEYATITGAVLSLLLIAKAPSTNPTPSIINEYNAQKRSVSVLRETTKKLGTLENQMPYVYDLSKGIEKREDANKSLYRIINNSPEVRAYKQRQTRWGIWVAGCFALTELLFGASIKFTDKRKRKIESQTTTSA